MNPRTPGSLMAKKKKAPRRPSKKAIAEAKKRHRFSRYTGWKNEEEMAATLVEWLKDYGATVYQEVQPSRYGRVADIVAILPGGKVWVIETKMSFGLEVLDQAHRWIQYAHMVSIATPTLRHSSDHIGRVICRKLGIGLLEMDPGYPSLKDMEAIVRIAVEPEFRRWAASKHITDRLTEKHKSFAKAGNALGMRLTPYKATCEEAKRVAKEKPGIIMKDLIEEIPHHYTSAKVARASLAKWIKLKKVKGLRAERDGKLLRIYPAEEKK